MELIAITTPYFWAGEAEAIIDALDHRGFSRVHLRKPQSTPQQMLTLIEAISERLRPRLSLHDHHPLATPAGIGGVHLNSRSPLPPPLWHGLVSQSLHSLDEIENFHGDYAFLSPIFPSISKPGYLPRFTLEEVAGKVDSRIYALGGVTPGRLRYVEEAGFGGAAMLGAAWSRSIAPDAFKLQFITNAPTPELTAQQVAQAAEGGCKWVQIRMKDATAETVEQAARLTAPVRERYGLTLLVDDHVALAARHNFIDGVHVGKNDMPVAQARRTLGPQKILGATANSYADIYAAATAGADYIGLGPFRFTTTKKNLSPTLGLDGYDAIMTRCRHEGIELPVVAIGGITEADIAPIISTGVKGIAVSGTIINANDPRRQTALLAEDSARALARQSTE